MRAQDDAVSERDESPERAKAEVTGQSETSSTLRPTKDAFCAACAVKQNITRARSLFMTSEQVTDDVGPAAAESDENDDGGGSDGSSGSGSDENDFGDLGFGEIDRFFQKAVTGAESEESDFVYSNHMLERMRFCLMNLFLFL